LLWQDELIGVLSLYSPNPDGFSDDHKTVVEAVAREVAHVFKGTAVDGVSKRDALTGLQI
jgi:putative methionine-R-sulfoxide reductase with GAF domain